MTEARRPSAKAWELLTDFEDDPYGIGFLDVEKLLQEWGVNEPLPGGDLIGYRAWRHPAVPDLIFYYPLKPELGSQTVLAICRQVRMLHERLTT